MRDPGFDFKAEDLFSMYMKVTGVPTLSFDEDTEPAFRGRTLGIVNGSSWISLWSTWFARRYLPGVKLASVGNEAVQLNFMDAHHRGLPTPPVRNIELFARYAQELDDLYHLDALIVTCSTMNRAAQAVRAVLEPRGIPFVQIDEPMMRKAVRIGGRILVVATHGPTVENTQALLRETSAAEGRDLAFAGAVSEEAFHLLGRGLIREHNEAIARALREASRRERIDAAVLAQLSMSVFKLTYPDCEREFGFPVLTSGECGFEEVARIFRETPRRT